MEACLNRKAQAAACLRSDAENLKSRDDLSSPGGTAFSAAGTLSFNHTQTDFSSRWFVIIFVTRHYTSELQPTWRFREANRLSSFSDSGVRHRNPEPSARRQRLGSAFQRQGLVWM